MMDVKILYQDDNMAAFYKPAGFHVHPHENPIHRVHRSQVLLYQARDMLGKYIFPVHRLDAGTSGVIMFALTKPAAKHLSELMAAQVVEKSYEAVARGWVPESGRIDCMLELDSTNDLVPATTDYALRAKLELPFAVGKRHATARYSLVQAFPRTGRFHQIRRHMARIAHPLLGDAEHGDSKHNRFFRETVGIAGLCLRAEKLTLKPEWSDKIIEIDAPICPKWQKIHQLFANPSSLAIQNTPEVQNV